MKREFSLFAKDFVFKINIGAQDIRLFGQPVNEGATISILLKRIGHVEIYHPCLPPVLQNCAAVL